MENTKIIKDDAHDKALESLEKLADMTTGKDGHNLKFDVYYPRVKHLTFFSNYFEINEDEARSIVAFFRYKYNKTQNVFFDDHAQILRQLEKKIDTFMKTHFTNKDVFVKFSFRSPKDGKSPLILQEREFFNKYLQEYKTIWDPSSWKLKEGYKFTEEELELNLRRNAFIKGHFKVLRCSTAKDVMALITSSVQIYTDLEMMDIRYSEFRQKNTPYDWDVKLIFRDWVENDMCHEIRCFVHKNYLTCMTQNMSGISEEYTNPEFVTLIRDEVFKYWKERLHPCFENFLETYSFDITWNFKDGKYDRKNLLNMENLEFYLVELNNFKLAAKFLLYKDKENGEDDSDLLEGVNLNYAEYSKESVVFKVRTYLNPGFIDGLHMDYFDDDENYFIPNNYETVLDEVDPQVSYRCSII